MTRHPGKIEIYEGGTLVKTLDAAKVPDSVRFAPTKDGLAAVVKVVASDAGAQTHIREFGIDGALLRSTTRLKDQSPKT